MLRLGIPEYRLPRDVIDKEVAFVRWLGVEFRLGFEVGRDATLDDLAREFGAVFLAPGCRKGKLLNIPGAELRGVLTALDFLAKVNLGVPVEIGQRVVVVGGGSVAYDAARSASRMESQVLFSEPSNPRLAMDAAAVAARVLNRDVTMVALEASHEMPADPRDVAEGAEERVRVLHRRGPKEVVGVAGRVTALRTLGVARVFDELGRFAPEMIEGSEREVPCDTLVLAVGQVADLSFLGEGHGIGTTPRGLVAVDRETLATSRPGVFAGGDVVFGPRIVIEAVADGRRAARSIDTHVTGRRDAPQRHRLRVFDTFGYDHPFARGDYEKVARGSPPLLSLARRTREAEVERGLPPGASRREGTRCLHCWVHTVFDASRAGGTECVECGGCVDVCPEQCIDLVSLRRVEGMDGRRGAALLKDETACIRCGLCARRCPVGLITMQALYREEEAPLARLADEVI
ncbi:MAG: FAD-dependent oxidoreductase [Myxococcota bacterium]